MQYVHEKKFQTPLVRRGFCLIYSVRKNSHIFGSGIRSLKLDCFVVICYLKLLFSINLQAKFNPTDFISIQGNQDKNIVIRSMWAEIANTIPASRSYTGGYYTVTYLVNSFRVKFPNFHQIHHCTMTRRT